MQQCLQHKNQILTCLHGQADTGKSHVLKALYQGLYRLLHKNPGQQTNNLITLLVAPTEKQHTILQDKQYIVHSIFLLINHYQHTVNYHGIL